MLSLSLMLEHLLLNGIRKIQKLIIDVIFHSILFFFLLNWCYYQQVYNYLCNFTNQKIYSEQQRPTEILVVQQYCLAELPEIKLTSLCKTQIFFFFNLHCMFWNGCLYFFRLDKFYQLIWSKIQRFVTHCTLLFYNIET